jgi:hypothetical protein
VRAVTSSVHATKAQAANRWRTTRSYCTQPKGDPGLPRKQLIRFFRDVFERAVQLLNGAFRH